MTDLSVPVLNLEVFGRFLRHPTTEIQLVRLAGVVPHRRFVLQHQLTTAAYFHRRRRDGGANGRAAPEKPRRGAAVVAAAAAQASSRQERREELRCR